MKNRARNVLIALSVVAIVAGPVFAAPASALTVEELQAQIRELLAKVAELTKQLNAAQGQEVPKTVPGLSNDIPVKHRICAILKRNLARGVSGDDVSGLQEFLRDQGYFSENATGYFGPLTSQALARWQAAQGLEGAGVVGPMTRERFRVWCGGLPGQGGGANAERFNAAPQRGQAPLTVTFSTWLSGFRVPNISYTIDFGDGSSERATDCYAPADACVSPGENKHTYASNGTYTATLNKIIDPCAGQVACRAAVHSEVVAKALVYVGDVVGGCTKEYRPVCGQKSVVCVTTPCNPVQQTYGNRCMMEADSATLLYEGACRPDNANPEKDARCRAWYDGCNSCSRETPNGPAACTLRACFQKESAYCTAYFDTASTQPVVCTADAMQCPNGQWVGRTGPNCEFACSN